MLTPIDGPQVNDTSKCPNPEPVQIPFSWSEFGFAIFGVITVAAIITYLSIVFPNRPRLDACIRYWVSRLWIWTEDDIPLAMRCNLGEHGVVAETRHILQGHKRIMLWLFLFYALVGTVALSSTASALLGRLTFFCLLVLILLKVAVKLLPYAPGAAALMVVAIMMAIYKAAVEMYSPYFLAAKWWLGRCLPYLTKRNLLVLAGIALASWGCQVLFPNQWAAEWLYFIAETSHFTPIHDLGDWFWMLREAALED